MSCQHPVAGAGQQDSEWRPTTEEHGRTAERAALPLRNRHLKVDVPGEPQPFAAAAAAGSSGAGLPGTPRHARRRLLPGPVVAGAVRQHDEPWGVGRHKTQRTTRTIQMGFTGVHGVGVSEVANGLHRSR